MKSTLALSLMMLASSAFAGISYSNSTDIATAHSNIRLTDVRFVNLPSKTEVREIPNCNPNGEASRICTEVVVLETAPAVQVTVSFRDGLNQSQDQQEGYTTLNLDPASFTAAELAALEGARFSARKSWAAKNLSLATALVTRSIQVVDVRNSTICPTTEAGTTVPGCVEDIQYRTASTRVREVTVNAK